MGLQEDVTQMRKRRGISQVSALLSVFYPAIHNTLEFVNIIHFIIIQ
jgi:hypothetical protein